MRYELDISPEVIADKIRPLLADAKRAYGSQPPESPYRLASDEVNGYVLHYVERGGNVPDLARCLEGHISLSGLRRRIRIARAYEQAALEGKEQVVGRTKRPRGKKDPELVRLAVEKIELARAQGGRTYGDAVRKAYDDGISLTAIAKEMNLSYYSLWSAKRTSW